MTREKIQTAEELGLMAGPPPFDPQRLVTLANWQEPPFNRWGFQHVSELIPSARIRRGDGLVWRLPARERDLVTQAQRIGVGFIQLEDVLDLLECARHITGLELLSGALNFLAGVYPRLHALAA